MLQQYRPFSFLVRKVQNDGEPLQMSVLVEICYEPLASLFVIDEAQSSRDARKSGWFAEPRPSGAVSAEMYMEYECCQCRCTVERSERLETFK